MLPARPDQLSPPNAEPMDIEAILRRLTDENDLPVDALLAAAASRREVAPRLIQDLAAFTADPDAHRGQPTTIFFGIHLLAEWRETAAYRPLLQWLRLPEKDVNEVLNDCVGETLARVVAALYDGDPQPIFDVIHDPKANGFVRWQLFKALTILVRHGRLDCGRCVGFLTDCLAALLPQGTDFVWVGWQEAVSTLGLVELAPLVKQAFDREFICLSVSEFEDFEADLEGALAPGATDEWLADPDNAPYDNTVVEFSSWACFSGEEVDEDDHDEFDDDFDDGFDDGFEGLTDDDIDMMSRNPDEAVEFLTARILARKAARGELFSGGTPIRAPAEPVRNRARDVGRNDPCPCASGKKYKKCCLD
jgi:hypothetical protein